MDLALDGAMLYVAVPGCGLRLVDVADPARPRETARLDDEADFAGAGLLLFDLNAVVAAGDYAYVGGYGLLAMDVSDPADPRAAGSVVGRNLGVADLVLHEGSLYAAGYPGIWGNEPTLVQFALNDRGQPTEVATVALPGGIGAVGRMVAAGGLFAVARGPAGGLVTVDVSAPDQPVVASAYDAVGRVHAVTQLGEHEVLAGDVGGEVYRVGMDDADELTVRQFLTLDQTAEAAWFWAMDVDDRWLSSWMRRIQPSHKWSGPCRCRQVPSRSRPSATCSGSPTWRPA